MSATRLADRFLESDQHEGGGHSRWMVSYADFMTLLLVFFVALYAMQSKKEAPGTNSAKVTTESAGKQNPSRLADKMVKLLEKEGLSEQVSVGINKGHVELGIASAFLFQSGNAQLTEEEAALLKAVSSVLKKHPGPVRVEGHTDSQPISNGQYPSNWELSAARAASVVRVLQSAGIPASRLSAVGLADTQPALEGKGTARNRRVNLVLLDKL